MLQKLQRASDLPDEDRSEVEVAIKRSISGTVSVLAQRAKICWGGGDQSESVLLPASVVQRQTVANISQAIWSSMPCLSLEQLRSLAPMVVLLIFTLQMDAASYTRGVFEDVAANAPVNMACFLMLCTVHQLSLVFKDLCATTQLISPLYSLGCLLRLTDYRARLIAAIVRLISHELEWEPAAPPNPQWAPHSKRILRHTLYRDRNTRARAHGTVTGQRSEPGGPARNSTLVDDLGARLESYCQGNWVNPRMAHYCQGAHTPCTRKEAVKRASQACVDLLLHNFPRPLAESKIGSIVANQKLWASGFGISDIFGRAFRLEFGRGRRPNANGGDDSLHPTGDYTQLNGRRARTGVDFTSNSEKQMENLLLAIVAEPLDSLIALETFADQPAYKAAGCPPILPELSRPDGPIHECLHALGQMLDNGSDLACVIHAYTAAKPLSASRDAFWTQWSTVALEKVTQAGAAVHIRSEWKHVLSLPHGMWAALVPGVDAERVGQRIVDEPDCCQDPAGSRKVVAVARARGGGRAFRQGPIRDALNAAVGIAGSTIMLDEDQHRQDRTYGSSDGKPVSVERVRHEGVVRRVMADYERRGGRNHAFLTERDLQDMGVVTVASQRAVKQRRKGVPGVPGSAYQMYRISQQRRAADPAHRVAVPRSAPGIDFRTTLRARWHADARLRSKWRHVWRKARTRAQQRAQRSQVTGDQAEVHPAQQHRVDPARTWWRQGDSAFPVSEEALHKWLLAHANGCADGLQRHPGFKQVVQGARGDDARQMLVGHDAAKEAPPKLAKTCAEKHAGFCCTRNANISAQVLRIGANLGKHFMGRARKDVLGRCYIFTVQVGRPLARHTTHLFAMLSAIRFKPPLHQVFAMFLEVPGEEVAPGYTFRLRVQRRQVLQPLPPQPCRPDGKRLAFLTGYALAVQMADARERVTVHMQPLEARGRSIYAYGDAAYSMYHIAYSI